MVLSFRRYIGFLVAWAVGLVTLAAMPSQAVPQSFAATGVGQIPDSMICGSAGIPLALSFNVTGMGAPLTDVRVTLNFAPAHTFVGDLTATLRPPAGSPSVILFSRVGSTTANSAGSGASMDGSYTFVDPSVSTANIWAAASGGVLVPSGTYAVTLPGPVATTPAGMAPMTSVFAGLSAAQINGTWTLNITDRCTSDVGGISQATLQLDSAPPAQEFTVNPLQLNFDVVDVNELTLRAFRVTAAASNTQNIDITAANCSIGGADAGQFARLFSNVTLAPGASVQLPMAFRPTSLGNKTALLTCTGVLPSGVTPTVLAVSLVGVAGVPAPPPNCYDVDGDGVMNPLTDGLFMLRLQLGIAPVTAASGIVLNAPRNTPLKAALFMAQRCGFHVPD